MRGPLCSPPTPSHWRGVGGASGGGVSLGGRGAGGGTAVGGILRHPATPEFRPPETRRSCLPRDPLLQYSLHLLGWLSDAGRLFTGTRHATTVSAGLEG